MLNLLGASPAAGALVGFALLVFGVTTGRLALAVAGGFVLVVSMLRQVNKPHNNDRSTREPDTDEWRR